MAPYRRYLVSIPAPRTHIRRDNAGGYLVRPVPRSSYPGDGPSHSRRRRAAADDLWRSCQRGGDCPPDVYNKYTHNTTADKILQWGSGGVFFGGLGIGTEAAAGAEVGARDPIVPWPKPPRVDGGSSFIPPERPFQLPGADIPVRVDPATSIPTPVRPVEMPPGNTFINPAFDSESVISVSSTDNVVIGEPVPAPPVPEVEDIGPFTRGDTFVFEHELSGQISEDRLPFFPRLSDPQLTLPFETVEMVELNPIGGSRDPLIETTSFGGEDIVGGEEDFLTSTPDPAVRTRTARPPARVAEVTIDNPLYDSFNVHDILESSLRQWMDPEDVVDVGPLVVGARGRGRTVTVSRTVRLPGMRLRSGRRLPMPVLLVGEVSAIDPDWVELSALQPVGTGDTWVEGTVTEETSFSNDTTVAWDGRTVPSGGRGDSAVWAPLPADDGFVDVSLEDPFPEMEIEEDEVTGDVSGVVIDPRGTTVPATGTSAAASVHHTRFGHSGHSVVTPRVIVPVGGGGSGTRPIPGVPVTYDGAWDPSLFWWWYLKRRRRVLASFYR